MPEEKEKLDDQYTNLENIPLNSKVMTNIRRARRILSNPLNEKYWKKNTEGRSSWRSVDRTEQKIGICPVFGTKLLYDMTCPLSMSEYSTLYVMEDKADELPPSIPYKGIGRVDAILEDKFERYIKGKNNLGKTNGSTTLDHIYGICDNNYCARSPDFIDFFAGMDGSCVEYHCTEDQRQHSLLVRPIVIKKSTWRRREDEAQYDFHYCNSGYNESSLAHYKEQIVTGILVSDVPLADLAREEDEKFVSYLRRLQAKRSSSYTTYDQLIDEIGEERYWWIDALAWFNGRGLLDAMDRWCNRSITALSLGVRAESPKHYKPIRTDKFMRRMPLETYSASYYRDDDYRRFIYSSEFAKMARDAGASKYYAQESVTSLNPTPLNRLDRLITSTRCER